GRRSSDRVPAGALPVALLLPGGGARALRPRGADSGTVERRAVRGREEARRGGRRIALRAPDGGHLPQHGVRRGRRRHAARALPEDAHPGRPALLREVLLHARRPRVPVIPDALRAGRGARLLGPVVPGGGALDGADRRGGALLPDRDRLARVGEGAVREGTARRVGARAEKPRGRERRLRGGAEPG